MEGAAISALQGVAAFTSPAQTFYGLQFATLLALWLAVKLGSGVNFLRLAVELSPVALRPSWLPTKLFLPFVRDGVYLPVAYSLMPLLAFAAAWPGCAALRLLVAVAASLFQLGECSRTTSHRDYLMVYNAWGLAGTGVLGTADAWAQGLALGLCVYLIFASGVAKVRVGGWTWGAEPDTLQAVLQTFAAKKPKEGGPVLLPVNKLVSASRTLAAACSVFALVLECLLAPMTLLLPAECRIVLGYLTILLHLGIAALQSGAIGAFFLPCAASYVFGLHDFANVNLAIGSGPWILAVAAFVVPNMVCLALRRLLPEDWPLTTYALFPWRASQWRFLHSSFVEGDTRLVMTDGRDPVGLRVVQLEHKAEARRQQWQESTEGHPYDIWNRLVGVTTFQHELLEALLPAFDAAEARPPGGRWCADDFTRKVEEWLLASGRLVEMSTGRPLRRAFFVRVSGGVVEAVLSQGTPAAKEPLLQAGRDAKALQGA